ncbi:MAG TPA: orotidine-5'-phosphate decarboxylase [Candidatus Limnocylindrales bacterium]|nr:orotidine-5'-phosphate decarboxylase [Candidatus Limnocylindrales bacterium]
MSADYLDRLAARSLSVGSVLCVGLDPDPASMPRSFRPDAAGIEVFCRLILEATLPFAAAVKPNLAFFEAFGSAGLASLERLRASIPGDVPVILDGKRGDIGSTAARLASALFDALGADAVTVNPYLGSAAIEPLIDRLDRFAYILCRTSNQGADEIQGLVVAADPSSAIPAEALALRVARRVSTWGPGQTVGLVVAATAPSDMADIRAVAPGLPFLVPGVGAQGGDLVAALEHGPAAAPPSGDRIGRGLLVNVTRGIAGAAREGADPGEAVARAAQGWAARLPVLGLRPPAGHRNGTDNEVLG